MGAQYVSNKAQTLQGGAVWRYVFGTAHIANRSMTKQPPGKMERDEVLRVKLATLRAEHRDLDDAIRALEEKGTGDMFTIRRLKKQKLALKDRIVALEDEITPDIIA